MHPRIEFDTEKKWLEYLRVHFAATAKTPEFILQKVDSLWEDNGKRLAATAYADAIYKVAVADALIAELNKSNP